MTTGSSGATPPTACAPSGSGRRLPGSSTRRRRGAALMLLAGTPARPRWRDGIVDRAERDGPDEVGGRAGARQAGHALEDRRACAEAPVPCGIERPERREIAVETGIAGRATVAVPAGAPMAGHARGAIDKSLLGHGVADPDVEARVVREVRLRPLETVVHERSVPPRRVHHRGQRGGLGAWRIAPAGLAVGR